MCFNWSTHITFSLRFTELCNYFLGTALLVDWILVSVGGNFFMWVFTPLVNIIWHGVQFLMAHLGFLVYVKILVVKLNAWWQKLMCLIAGCSSQSDFKNSQSGAPVKLTLQQGSLLWLEIVGGIAVFIGLAIYMAVTVRRARLPRMSEGCVEVRQFIARQPAKARTKARVLVGSLSRMRRLYRKFLFAMQRRQFVRSEGETAQEFIGRIARVSRELRAEMQELTEYYIRERYGGERIDQK